jgi:monoterpene epsilon-lactone hydrolase
MTTSDARVAAAALSEEAVSYHDMLRGMKEQYADADGSIEETRAAGEGLGQLAAPLDPAAKVEPVDAGGVPALRVSPPGAGSATVLYLHGGGYAMCSAASHSRVAGHLAARLGASALVVDYRLAPENVHPAQVEDCLTAYRWLLENGATAADTVFAGESAGGALVVSTQLLALRRGLPVPAAAAAMSPWVDLESTGESFLTNAEYDLATTSEGQSAFASMFVGEGGDLRDALAAPLHADLTGLAPLIVQVGGDEALLSDAERLAARARAAHVPVELDVVPSMQHMFQLWAGVMPEANDALERVSAFLRIRLPQSTGSATQER